MSTQRTMPGGSMHPSSLPRGETGRALCRWCALEVPRGRFTFCSAWCVHEWRMRTSPAYLRQQVLKRDKGVCEQCRVSTLSAFLRMRKARGTRRDEMLAHWGLKKMTRRSLWDADHILPVAEGGGECDLRNLRTLCLRCHREATAQLRARLLLVRRQRAAAPAEVTFPESATIILEVAVACAATEASETRRGKQRTATQCPAHGRATVLQAPIRQSKTGGRVR